MEQERSLMNLLYRVQQGLESLDNVETFTSNYTEDRQGVYARVGAEQEFFPLTQADQLDQQLIQFKSRLT